LSFGVQGTDGTGGNRNAFQHPGSVAMWSGDTGNRTLELTLGTAARAGEKLALSYALISSNGPLKDTSGNKAPAFVDLVVTNDTPGVAVLGAKTTLVGNTGQSFDNTRGFADDNAQAFTTGSNTGGYKLTSVAVPYASATIPAASTHSVSIHASNSSNRPGASLGTLSYGSVSGTTVTYTASGDGISLASGTTYFVVLKPTSAPNLVAMRVTDSDNEDSGAADGWSLANTSLTSEDGTTWQSRTDSWQIAIDGAAVIPVTGPKGTLISNNGQPDDDVDDFDFLFDYRLPFTTGSNALGYMLTRVDLAARVGGSPAYELSMIVGGLKRTFTNPASLAVGLNQHSAPGNGIELAANTTYHLVLNATAGLTTPTLTVTTSDAEDGGGLAGWSIANTMGVRSWNTTAWNVNSKILKIAIHGAALTTVPAPQPQSASVAGTKLKIVFDKALDETATESGKHFTVVFSDGDGDQRTIAGTAANVAISGSTVTVTLAEAVPPNATAQVTYEPETPSLKAADDDIYVAEFLGFKIETVYDTAVPELMQAAVVQTSKNPDGFRVALYYDEALDPDSVPATADFGVTLDSTTALTPNAVAIEDKTVLLTLDLAKAPGDQGGDVTYTEADVSYTKGTNPIRDPAGNDAAAFTGLEQTGLKAKVEVEAAGTPAVAAPPAPEPGTLVSNTGQSFDNARGFASDTAQAFTTGSNTAGYKLTSVTVPYATTTLPAASTHSVSIHASNSSNEPGTSLGTLSYGSVSGNTVTYTASGDGISLAAGTTYFVVLIATSAPNFVALRVTDSDNEDSGAADGWSLANTGFSREEVTSPWQSRSDSWMIAIQGTPVVAAVVTETSDEGTLVGNTGQSTDSQSAFIYDYAQAFTTGSATSYTLTSVTVPYNTAAPPSGSHVIRIHASNSSNRPGASLGRLAYGTVSGQTATYTASGNGIGLDAGTTYFVVLDPSSSTTTHIKITNSDAEDAGASDGWSLADTSLWKPATVTSWNSRDEAWQIAIQGTTQVEKIVGALVVDGASLTVDYDKSLDPASLPDPDRFTLFELELERDDDDNLVAVEYGRVTAVAVSGKQLVLTLNGAAAPCDTFTLSYSRSETEKNIQ
ncbi:MAG: SwmB domain-containing protein, partial [Chloroflexi bacterium]|nr:SwmB domain-containing protein [Chloroflexota bacterium]